MELMTETESKDLKYSHTVIYKGEKMFREESMSPKCFMWEGSDELRDLHTISWRLKDDREDLSEYYSCDHGWSKDGICDKDNPIPEIEKEFKKNNR